MSQAYIRIKQGAALMHDHSFGRWPACKAAGGKHEADNPDMVFQAEINGDRASCKAYGFGINFGPGYGNGAIHASASDVVKPHMFQRDGLWYLGWPGEEPVCSGVTPQIVYRVWKWVQDGNVAEAQ